MRVSLLAGFLLLAVFFYLRDKKIFAAIFTVFSVWLIRYYDSWHEWLTGLGTDSLSEAQNFDWSEAWFLLQSLPSVFMPMRAHKWLETVSIAVAIALVITFIVRFITRKLAKNSFIYVIPLIAVIAIGTPIYKELLRASKYFQSNSTLYEQARQNFQNSVDTLQVTARKDRKDINVLVYIGESTTIMNWSLYGYPLDTNPKLMELNARDRGLLVFDNVLSPHTHTSQSLLETFSFPVSNDAYKQILARKRILFLDMLRKLNIPTYLASTQGQTGTFNLASSIVFADIDNKNILHESSKILGNMVSDTQYDEKEYFISELSQGEVLDKSSSFAILHSYTGHGPYGENLPDGSQMPMDEFYNGSDIVDLFGDKLQKPKIGDLIGYQSAMSYIDDSLSSVINKVAESNKPIIFVYFPDHGESPLTMAEHDSARFQHEMVRIPLLIYFNQAAQDQFSDLYEKYRTIAKSKQTIVLSQMPYLLMDILGYDIKNSGIALDNSALPIVVRQIADGNTFVRSSGLSRINNGLAKDVTDGPTTIWLNSHHIANNIDAQLLCYDNANSWAKANRGVIVADCLGITLDEYDDQLVIAPSYAKNDTWLLNAIYKLIESYDSKLYLDGSNLDSSFVCKKLDQQYASNKLFSSIANRVYLRVQDDSVPECQGLQAKLLKVFGADNDIVARVTDFNQLPYSPELQNSRMPELLVINTDWDINSRQN